MAGIFWIDGEGEPLPAMLGGKGAGLVNLHRAGFAVPPGFVVTTAATAALDHPETLAAIVSAFETLNPANAGTVAVRSSATGEDGEVRSHAGQHETILGIQYRQALLDAVSRIVESLDASHAVAYRETSDGGPAVMAVVIQRMVEATFSGVAFSIDPAGGEEDAVVLDVVPGTGEQLMAGQVRGSGIVVDRTGPAVRSADAGALELVGGESRAVEIAAAALRAEEVFGSPQDVEFAHDGETLWLLQSRPITAMPSPTAGWENEFDTPADERTIWTSANVQEVLPGLLTPLTITLSQNTTRIGYNKGFQQLKLLDRDEWQPFMGTFYNRAFLNLTVTRMIAERSPGGSGDVVERQYLAAMNGDTDASEREPWRRRFRFKAKSALPLAKSLLTMRGMAERIDHETRQLERATFSLDPEGLSDLELDDAFERLIAHTAKIFGTHLQVSGIASSSFDIVERLVRPVLEDETGARMPALFSGMQGVESAQIGLDIWNLAVVARNTGIHDAISAGDFDPDDPGLPDGWRAAWRTFLSAHGHRGLNEMEASARSWRRDPSPVVGMVASYLKLAPEQSPPATLLRQEAERLRLTEDVARRMNRVKRRLFRKVLADAQEWISLRERTKSVIVRAARMSDSLMPEIQGRLVDKGVVDKPDDVYFLSRIEVRRALRGESSESMQGHIRRRRREYERNRHVQLPERFRGRPVPLQPQLDDTSASVLQGTPVSPGIVTGRARVILDPSTERAIEPGEILVAPVTDAGWTPLFALASGLVVDMGSALSHGSTVAREYGLPAVVNVHSGTRSIRTGDLVTVNGSAGTVTISRAERDD